MTTIKSDYLTTYRHSYTHVSKFTGCISATFAYIVACCKYARLMLKQVNAMQKMAQRRARRSNQLCGDLLIVAVLTLMFVARIHSYTTRFHRVDEDPASNDDYNLQESSRSAKRRISALCSIHHFGQIICQYLQERSLNYTCNVREEQGQLQPTQLLRVEIGPVYCSLYVQRRGEWR